MNKIRSTKAITLVALIITIIILLILAGITLTTLTGENGLFTRAKEAKEKTEIADIKERVQMDILEVQSGNDGDITEGEIDSILEPKYGKLSGEGEDKILTTRKGYIIKVSDILNGETVKAGPKGPEFTTVANSPDISGFNKSNTYYVAWDLTSSPYTIEESTKISETAPSNWYDYTSGVNHWTNIKTTGGGNDCYWVWIPRYAYKVPTKGSTAETIDVKFLQDTTNIPIGETTAITNTIPTPDEWVVHPAFTNEGNGGFGNLTGIWFAKFEASSNSPDVVENPTAEQLTIDGGSETDIDLKVRVKPNVISWGNITVGNIFTVCQNLTLVGNSLESTNNIDSHMMKNTEWGAVAYLSRSIYGKNSAVWNNPYYNNYSSITGLAGSSQDVSQTNLTNTYKYNEVGGGNASTTGNVYGVYDMAGGAWEYVAGILSTFKSNSFYDFSNINSRYYDSYNSNDGTKYGDAVYETAGWDADCCCFVDSKYPVFRRVGFSSNVGSAGVFAYETHTGQALMNHSFRPCLVSSQ